MPPLAFPTGHCPQLFLATSWVFYYQKLKSGLWHGGNNRKESGSQVCAGRSSKGRGKVGLEDFCVQRDRSTQRQHEGSGGAGDVRESGRSPGKDSELRCASQLYLKYN